MRVALLAALVLLPAAPALAGSMETACEPDRTDPDAVAVDNVPRTRVSRQAADGWFYVTTKADPPQWRETNAWPGLQLGEQKCFDWWVEGSTWTLVRDYLRYVADTPVSSPEQAV